MADKQEMLAKIRAAIGRTDATEHPAPLPPFSTASRAASNEELINRFRAELEKVSARTLRVNSVDEIKSYVENLLPDSAPATVAVSDAPVLFDAGMREWLANKNLSVLPSLKEFASTNDFEDGSSLIEAYKRALMQASVGITSADYAIADTGTLVLISGGEQHRLISLVPPAHVCILDTTCIVATLADLLKLTHEKYSSGSPPPLAMTFITGPSRTADIELSLTLGVHGPRELHILLYQSK